MSCCLKILIKNQPRDILPEFLDSNGQLWLDVGDSRPKLTNKSGAINMSNGNAFDEAALGFKLPKTPKNMHYFEMQGMLTPNTVEPLNGDIDVFVIAGSMVLRQNKLFVKSIQPDGIEVEVRQDAGNWWAEASKLKIASLDLGSYTHDQTTIEARWANEAWQDGDPLYYHPLVHYGGFRDGTDEVWVEDFRPFLSVLGVLKKGFCAIGWDFQSPILEGNEWGRRLWMYILKDRYWEYSNRGSLYNVEGDYTSAQLIHNTSASSGYSINPDNITSDPGGRWVSTGNGYYSNGDRPVTVKVRLQGTILSDIGNIKFGLYDTNGNQLSAMYSFNPYGGGFGVTVDMESECVYLPAYGTIRIFNISEVGDITVSTGFSMTIEVCDDNRFYVGDNIALNEIVDDEVTLLDIVKGVSHMGLRIHADYSEKTVYMYPETLERCLIFGGDYEGFYLAGANMEYIGGTGAGCKVLRNNETPKDRYIRFAFKQSSDAYVRQQELEAEAPLYSKTVDLGVGNTDKTKDFRNPFFEPTADVPFGNGAKIPALWDNTDGKVSTKIAPRIVFAHGYIKQHSDLGGIAQYTYEGYDAKELMPYCSQLTDKEKDDGSGSSFIFMDGNVAYSDTTGLHSTDLYRSMLYFRAELLKPTMHILAETKISLTEYLTKPFRYVVLLKWKGKDMACFIEEVSGWDVCDWDVKLKLRPVTSKYTC